MYNFHLRLNIIVSKVYDFEISTNLLNIHINITINTFVTVKIYLKLFSFILNEKINHNTA